MGFGLLRLGSGLGHCAIRRTSYSTVCVGFEPTQLEERPAHLNQMRLRVRFSGLPISFSCCFSCIVDKPFRNISLEQSGVGSGLFSVCDRGSLGLGLGFSANGFGFGVRTLLALGLGLGSGLVTGSGLGFERNKLHELDPGIELG